MGSRRLLIALAAFAVGGLAGSASGAARAEDRQAAQIDNLAESLHAAGELDGTVLVARAGEVIYRKAFGVADCRTGQKNEAETVFAIASITKPFTALAVMMLSEEGKLDLEAPVRDALTGFPYENVTVEHLLTHTSGIPNYAHDPRFGAFLKELEEGSAVGADVVRWLEIEKPALQFAPGEQRRYSNTGYVILGRIVESVSGLGYGEFLERRVFDPLGMDRTWVWTGPEEAPARRWSRGHERSLDRRSREPFVSAHGRDLDRILGDSGIYSTVDDLFRLDQVLYTDELVSAEMLEKAFARFRLKSGKAEKSGYGWFVRSEPGDPRLVWHGGIGGGYLTSFHRQIDGRNTVIILSNGTPHHLTIDDFAEAVLDILHSRDHRPPRLPVSHPIAAALFDQDPAAAVALYRELRDNAAAEYLLAEHELNVLGYRLMWAGHLEEALAILELNAEEYPDSANVFDSLGDVHVARARAGYEKALAMDPARARTAEKLSRLTDPGAKGGAAAQ